MQFNYEENIRIFQDVFYPPEGYEIKWAELTTWSLAKDQLRMIAAMIAAANLGAARTPLRRPNSYIKAYGKEDPPFHLFYDGSYQLEQENSAYYQTANGRYSAYLLEHCCTPVKPKKGGLFHPKLILLQFGKKGEEGNIRFRLLVSSKNLTWSRYVESGVLLESDGVLQESKDGSAPGPAMARFLETYYKAYDGKAPSAIALNTDALEAAHFRVISRNGVVVDETPKLYFGKEQSSLQELMKNDFADFAKNESGKETFLRVCSMNPTAGLMEQKDYATQYICNFKDMYDRVPSDSNDWKKKESTDNHYYLSEDKENDNPGINPQPLHAKHYMFWGETKGKNKISATGTVTTYNYTKLLIWTGSANCSANGLNGTNEEAMLRFQCLAGKYSNQFPAKDPSSHRTEFWKRSDKSSPFHFCNADKMDNVEVSAPEDEEVSKQINISVTKAKYHSEKLSVELENKEDAHVFVWPAALSEADNAKKIEKNGKGEFDFSLPKAKFSRLLLARRDGGKEVYALLLTLTNNGTIDADWHGTDYAAKQAALPLDPLANLGDLIPEQPYFERSDRAFEKLAKCRMFMDEDAFNTMSGEIKSELEIYYNLITSDASASEEDAFEPPLEYAHLFLSATGEPTEEYTMLFNLLVAYSKEAEKWS